MSTSNTQHSTQLNNTHKSNEQMQAAMKAATQADGDNGISDELAQEATKLGITANPTPHSDGIVMSDALTLAGLGEELGQFKAYDSQLTIPEIEGTRIVKCLYMVSPKTGKKAQENSYVRITTKHLTEEIVLKHIAELTPYVLTWLQELEGAMIKENHKKGALSIFPASLSLDKLIDHLEANSEGSRLNKEKIEAWFTACVEPELAELFAPKMELDENSSEAELERLEVVLVAYKDKFASLAGGKTYIKPDDCKAMINVISSCSTAKDSLIGTRFLARLEKMMNKEDETLLSLL